MERLMPDAKFVWNNHYSVNYKPIDDQHIKIIEMLIVATEIEKGGAVTEKTFKVLQQLNDYIQVHFKFEEWVMKTIDFPALPEHEIEHRNLAGRTAKLCSDFLQEKTCHEELTKMLKEWWVSHILVKDMSYAEYIRRNYTKLAKLDISEMSAVS